MPGESIRGRLSALSRAELVGLVAMLAVTLGGAGLWYVRSLPRPVQIASEVPAGATASGAQTGAGPSSAPAAIVLVDVAGWVRSPGVYEFAEGARVVDAIEAAGGARRGALLQALNLAAPLADGTQILVPREGDVGSTASGGLGSGSAGALVNVNTATAAELEALPGIGEVIAQRIVDHRTANGPFTAVEQLLDVSGIGESILGSIRELVTV